MKNVRQQNDTNYLNFLENLHNGTVSRDNVDFVFNKFLTNIGEDVQCTFNDTIHLILQYKLAHPIVFNYLLRFTTTGC